MTCLEGVFEIGWDANPRVDEVFISYTKDGYEAYWYVNRKPFSRITLNSFDKDETMKAYYTMVKRVMEVWDEIYADKEAG